MSDQLKNENLPDGSAAPENGQAGTQDGSFTKETYEQTVRERDELRKAYSGGLGELKNEFRTIKESLTGFDELKNNFQTFLEAQQARQEPAKQQPTPQMSQAEINALTEDDLYDPNKVMQYVQSQAKKNSTPTELVDKVNQLMDYISKEDERKKEWFSKVDEDRRVAAVLAEKSALIKNGVDADHLENALALAQTGRLGEVNTVDEAWTAYQNKFKVLFEKDKENGVALNALNNRLNTQVPSSLESNVQVASDEVRNILSGALKSNNAEVDAEFWGR